MHSKQQKQQIDNSTKICYRVKTN